MAHAMEEFFWAWVQRLLPPLFAEVQTHKVSAFDWSPAHWAEMARQSQSGTQSRYAGMQAKEAENLRQTNEKVALAKQRDEAAIGTFGL